MPKSKHRPAFTTEGSSDGEASSRSRSRDRYDLEAARTRAGARTGSFSISTSPPRIVIPAEIDEEAAMDDFEGENQPLLSSSVASTGGGDNGTPGRLRPQRAGSLYGSLAYGGPRFIKLTEQGDNSGNGGGLTRNQSIFKLSGMIDDRGGDFEEYRKSDDQLSEIKSKKIRQFYEAQNEILDGFGEVDEILDNTQSLATTGELAPMIPTKPSAGREEALGLKVKLAINVNFLVNFFLLAGKIAVVLLSNSMSLVASTVDSAMDFLSTLIIFGTSKIVEKRDWKTSWHYPTGKRRMEPMGVVVFSVFMIASFLQVFIESFQRLISKDLEQASIPLIGKIVMGVTIGVKLVVWFWCRSIKNSSVEALAQDAENDIVFNTFSLLFPFVGELLHWKYLDPLGGALLSIYIMVEWTGTLLETIQKLSGKRASPKEHQRVAYLLTRFSPLIKHIQHLSVCHTGDGLIVEADVILPTSTTLTASHNLAESAQYAIEQLEGVERAYVHVDVTVNDLSGHLPR